MSSNKWWDQTVNPIIGCSHVSAGCENCYAEKMAGRLACMNVDGYATGNIVKRDCITGRFSWTGKTTFVESQLDKVLKRKKPTRFFWGSMGDMFHESVEWQWLIECMWVMRNTEQHTHMLLTKRPDKMQQFLKYMKEDTRYPLCALPNVWFGTTLEHPKYFSRVECLIKTQALNRFLSIEPMLHNVDLSKCIDNLDLVICGGESGPHARPIDPEWVYYLQAQCQMSGTEFFFKQWGSKPITEHMKYRDLLNYNEGVHTVRGRLCNDIPERMTI